jgi:cardiolipin synthase A/B
MPASSFFVCRLVRRPACDARGGAASPGRDRSSTMTRSLRANPPPPYCVADPQAVQPVRQVGSQALSRASGAPLVPGNRVQILEDAGGNYPMWLEAIGAAKRTVYFENYIFEEDDVGRLFAEALIERARAGVRVRLIRDWLGSFRGASRSFWRRLSAGGVDVRAFNPPRLGSPFGWVTRDHRKVVAVDGQVAFVAGLCVSDRWKGNPARGIPPWRDTGVEIRGPAVADVEQAFAELWESIGEPIPADERAPGRELVPAGEVALRVIAGVPSTAGLFRLDQFVAAVARRTLWLTDAYFVGVTSYVQALRAAARDGVDVRLLVPNATDLPLVQSLSRAGYRPLLEAGVRIFEWNGSMLHAKTAVADGRWTRIGSSNLNIASYLGNYEMDVAIEDATVARHMEEIYVRDLSNATEVRLARRKVLSRVEAPGQARLPRAGASASGRAAVGALRVANAVGAAVTNHRVMDRVEARLLLTSGLALIALAVVATLWPRIIAAPLSVVGFWVGGALVWRARTLVRRRGTPPPPAPVAGPLP